MPDPEEKDLSEEQELLREKELLEEPELSPEDRKKANLNIALVLCALALVGFSFFWHIISLWLGK